MNKNIQGDFQICISVPLSYTCQNANFVVKFRTLEKQKLNFATGSTVAKVNIQHSEMVTKRSSETFSRLLLSRWPQ